MRDYARSEGNKDWFHMNLYSETSQPPGGGKHVNTPFVFVCVCELHAMPYVIM